MIEMKKFELDVDVDVMSTENVDTLFKLVPTLKIVNFIEVGVAGGNPTLTVEVSNDNVENLRNWYDDSFSVEEFIETFGI